MPHNPEALFERVQAATAGDYIVERELGRGGMAAVYLARDTVLHRRVAIKVVLPDLVDDAEAQDRFLIEAQATAHLDHPGIVTVYSVRKRADLAFIVMKYIDGRTLDRILHDDGRIDPVVVAGVVSQVAEALHFAHSEGVVHRDVKPSNILVDRRGRAYVTDFGIAKLSTAQAITLTGTVIGTPIYMSPEQCRGLVATPASDQYALGVAAFQLLTGQLPFQGNLFELIHAHSYEAAPALHEISPAIQPEVEQCVMRMLAKRPQDRWPSMSDVVTIFSQRARAAAPDAEVRRRIGDLAAREAPARESGGVDTATLEGANTELLTTPQAVLVISPGEPSIEVGDTVALRLSEASGASLADATIVWRSEDASIAFVDAEGRVTGRAVGVAKITASARQGFGRVTLRVTEATVDTVVVTPQQPAVSIDGEQRLAATVLDPRGNVLSGKAVVWTSSNVDVCTVSQTGRIVGIATGEATVAALCGDVAGTATVRVDVAVPVAAAGPPGSTLRTGETPVGPAPARRGAAASARRRRSTMAAAAVVLLLGSYLVAKQRGARPDAAPATRPDSAAHDVPASRDRAPDRGAVGAQATGSRSRPPAAEPDRKVADATGPAGRPAAPRAPDVRPAPDSATPQVHASGTAPERAVSPAVRSTVDRDRTLRCTDSGAALSAISGSLDTNVADVLSALYEPRDTTDARAKADLLALVREAGGPGDGGSVNVTPQIIAPEPSGSACIWVAALRLRWTNAFGQARERSPHIRVELGTAGGHATVRHFFGATGVR